MVWKSELNSFENLIEKFEKGWNFLRSNSAWWHDNSIAVNAFSSYVWSSTKINLWLRPLFYLLRLWDACFNTQPGSGHDEPQSGELIKHKFTSISRYPAHLIAHPPTERDASNSRDSDRSQIRHSMWLTALTSLKGLLFWWWFWSAPPAEVV